MRTERSAGRCCFQIASSLWYAVVFLGVFSCFSASASAVSFESAGAEAAVGKTAAVEVRMNTDGALSAALFTFYYDAAVAEFREAKAEHPSEIVTSASEGCVKISFLNADGAAGDTVLFTLSFRGRAQGDGCLAYEVRGCVDSQAGEMTVGAVNAGVLCFSEEEGAASPSPAKATAPVGAAKSVRAAKNPTEARGTTAAADVVPGNDGMLAKARENRSDNKMISAAIVICLSSAAAASVILFLLRRMFLRKGGKKTRSSGADGENTVNYIE